MTEAEWLAATDPTPMLEFLNGKVSDRKWRLVGVACARYGLQFLQNDRCRSAVEVVERKADGMAHPDELRAACGEVEDEMNIWPADDLNRFWWAVGGLFHPQSREAAQYSASAVLSGQEPEAQIAVQAALFCIVGNPFCPVAVEPSWLTSTVIALAEGIYKEKAFDRLPILADALQDAGCDNDDVLSHCRSDESHVRGCWVVDLLTGRK
jgi:hypothetical protein